jgi:hypothetical protein
LPLSAFFWKAFCGELVGQSDIQAVNKGLFDSWDCPHRFKDQDLRWAVRLSDKKMQQLLPNGSRVPVMFEDKELFLTAVWRARLQVCM